MLIEPAEKMGAVIGLATGSVHASLVGHAGYLVVMTVLGLAFAGRRMGRLLLK